MSGASYYLCGFASGVDFKPIKFKECLPPVRICGLCGFVPDKVALLPCSHLLCESCLQGSADGDDSVCPIDAEPFRVEGGVSWIKPSRCHFSKMQVYCWNADTGCTFQGTTGQLLQHFESECSFHAVTCPRCQDTVLRRDLPRHYKAGCAASAPSPVCMGSASQENDSPIPGRLTSSYDDMLSSLQGRTNELLESINILSRRLLDSEEPLETVSVEQQLRTLSQSLHTFLERTQEANALTSAASTAAENSLSRASTNAMINSSAEEYVVLTLNVYTFNVNAEVRCNWETCFTLVIEGKPTNIDIQCLALETSRSVTLLAKLTRPGEWCLPDVEPLPSGEFFSPFFVSWAYADVCRQVLNVRTMIRPDFTARCICKIPEKATGQYSVKQKSVNVLMRMKRSDIRKS